MTANPFAALLAGVRRFYPQSAMVAGEPMKPAMYEDEVLAALTAAVPADLVEAGKVAAWLRDKGPWDIEADGQPHEIVTALLARIAAQRSAAAWYEQLNRHNSRRAEAAETALAAERAKVAKLVEVGKRLLEPLDEPCRHDHHGYCQAHFLEADCSVVALRAAITEASQ